MRYLGIDYGTKRVGIALSDEEGKIAFPNDTLANDRNLVKKIVELCTDKKIGTIVVGESNDFSGKPNPIMEAVRNLAEILKEKTKLPVILEPEFLTTAQAKQIQGEVEGIDASAAALILQSYLDKMRNSKLQKTISKQIPNSNEQKENKIPYEDFVKIEIKVGKILTAEKIPNTDKLLKLSVDFGEEKPRQIVSGIAIYYPDPLQLVGKNCLFVTNLEPRVIRGEESNGMILALSTPDGAFSLLEPDKAIPMGMRVK